MAKFVFVTGGVVSSLGKGITAASIGLLLKSRGLNVIHQKFDPYLNVDPGTMNPYQHGEVYVTDDGAETDLDLGHYERFTGATTNRNCNFTSGRIYDTIIKKERRGDYLGGTVQVVPHVTQEICDSIRSVVTPEIDVVICEIGGTVGDIESLPFLEALRLFRMQEGRGRCFFIHVTLVPYLAMAGEVKTKPTQHSVGRLREIGIIPDMLVCRSEVTLDKDVRRKIALFCNVDEEAVVEARDVHNTIYEVPLEFASQDIDTVIIDAPRAARRTAEPAAVARLCRADHERRADGRDRHRGQIQRADRRLQVDPRIAPARRRGRERDCQDPLRRGRGDRAEGREGDPAWGGRHPGPGGFGGRGVEGKITAVRYARENKIPYFGICYGMHMAVIEFARNVLKLDDADTTENNPGSANPVIHLMEEQKKVMDLGGTMRLGAFPCNLGKGTIIRKIYGKEQISERHRHRYEFNNDYRKQFEKAGMVLSGISPNGILVETVELKDHPWFVGVQFHPEFKSRPIDPHPLFREFVAASLKNIKG